MAIYIGLDVHSQQTTYHVVNERKEKVVKGQVSTQAEALVQFSQDMLALDPEVHVAIESGGQSRWVTRILLNNGLDAHVFHATEVAAKRPKKEYKNDENDAKDLAHGMLHGLYEMEVYIPTDGAQQMRQDTVQRLHFVEMRSLSQILAKALLRGRSLPAPKCLDSHKAWQSLIREHAGTELEFFLDLHYQSYVHAEKMVDLIEARMHQSAVQNAAVAEDIDLLTTIPGVGFLTAYALVGVIGELSRFPSAAQLSSYLGLVPRSYDSGSRRQAGHITRSGPWYMRKLLCQCAQQARKGTNPLAAYYYAVLGRSGSAKKAIVAVMHRIARIAFQVLKTRRPFDTGRLRIHAELDPKTGKPFWRMERESAPRRRSVEPVSPESRPATAREGK